MARRAHDSADSRRGRDRRGATRNPRRRLARTVSDPARRRLVLLDLPLALADLGVRTELAVRTGYGVGATQKMLMVLASLALGAASCRYVEQPVRIRRDLWTSRRLLTGSGISFAVLAGFVSL